MIYIFLSGLIFAVGFYFLFYTLSRPDQKWRRIVLLAAIAVNHIPVLFLHRYHFKKGLSYPYKMERIKTIVRQKYSFNDYHIVAAFNVF